MKGKNIPPLFKTQLSFTKTASLPAFLLWIIYCTLPILLIFKILKMSDVKNLDSIDAIAKLKELAEKIKTCMFCTNLSTSPFSTRPMGISEVDADGKFWFLSASSSNKNREIKQDEKVQLIFSDPANAQFLSVFGEADIFDDEKSIEKAWTPLAKAWFPEGKDDINVTVIKVHPFDAYYWDTKDGKMISLLKIATAAFTGSSLHSGVEGKLTVEHTKF